MLLWTCRWEEGKRTNVLNPRDLVRKHGAAFACDIPGVRQLRSYRKRAPCTCPD